MNRRNSITLAIGTLVGVVLILSWLHYNPVHEIRMHFSSVNYRWVLLSSIAYLSAYFIRACRWKLLLPSSTSRNKDGSKTSSPSMAKVWMYAMAGNLINYIIPIRAGDVARAWFLKRNHNVPFLKGLPSVFIDKAFDTIAILFVIIILPFLAIEISKGMLTLLVLLLLVFVLTLGLLILAAWRKDTVITIVKGVLFWIPQRFKQRVHDAIEVFISELNTFEHHPAMLLATTLLTALGILLDGLYFFLLFKAFSISFPFPLALFGYTLINLSYALPQPPVQLGSNEWMMIIVFSVGFGLTKSSAAAIMAFAHILTFLLMFVLGSIAIAVSGVEIITKIFKGDKIHE